MKLGNYIDENQILQFILESSENDVKIEFSLNNKAKSLSKNIIENLKSIVSVREKEDHLSYSVLLNDKEFLNISKDGSKIEHINKLTSFETRMLAQGRGKEVPFFRDNASNFEPKTDLHTHFAGAMTPDTLIDVALKKNVKYPVNLLEKIGVKTQKYIIDENGMIDLKKIESDDMSTLKENLIISQITQETFNKMEEVYTLRGPFTKNKELFPDYLKALAQDYKKDGVKYAELSFSSFISDPEYMKMLDDNLPKIEEETGVKMRFLAGIWRHSDKEWNLDDTDRIMSIARSPYIVGCDVMGHETNSTDVFKEELQKLSRYAMKEDPYFAIRVHAGENPMFKDNVKKALQIVYNEHSDLEKEDKKEYLMPNIRIGHGLYGVDDEVLDLAKKMDATIEFNMSSNLALNNINSITEIPIKKYLDKNINVVLGTDGHGMYSTSEKQEKILATAAGVKSEDFKKIEKTENKIINNAIIREKSHPRLKDVNELYNFKYSTLSNEKRYTKEVEQKYRKQYQEASKHLGEKIAFTGAITDENVIENDTKDKIPIMITGASKSNWPNISPKDQEYIELTMQVLANNVNTKKAYIVTGGTNYGVEQKMHEAVYRRNKNKDGKLMCLGTLTMEAANDTSGELKENTITHATILELDGRKANNWQELPDTQLNYVKEKKGSVIAIGGGGVVNDMIQRAHNMGADLHLMDGPYGASTNKSKSLDGNNYSFKTIEDLLKRLNNKDPEIFNEGFSLDEIDKYIEEARAEINYLRPVNNPANFGLGTVKNIYNRRILDISEGVKKLTKYNKEYIENNEKKAIG